jgi:putative redox protein
MATGISVQYQGKLRCEATREQDGQSVQTDVGADHGGQGEYLSPVEMAVAALGACSTSMLALVAERNGIDVSTMQTMATFDMADAPRRCIGAIRLTIKLPDSVPEAMRPKLEAAAKACPVKNSLHPDVRIDLEFVYG